MNELQLQYSITEHDGDFEGSPQEHDTTFYDLDVNWRHYFWPKSPLQPYGLLGMGWGRAKIENGSTDQATGTVFEDAELKDGINFNVGVGAALYTLPWVTSTVRRCTASCATRSPTASTATSRTSATSTVDGWNLSVGAAFRLLPGRKASSHYRNQPK
jgi:opacity protein-like surface antigen